MTSLERRLGGLRDRLNSVASFGRRLGDNCDIEDGLGGQVSSALEATFKTSYVRAVKLFDCHAERIGLDSAQQ